MQCLIIYIHMFSVPGSHGEGETAGTTDTQNHQLPGEFMEITERLKYNRTPLNTKGLGTSILQMHSGEKVCEHWHVIHSGERVLLKLVKRPFCQELIITLYNY